MPIYDYKCRKCGERFEIEQSITDDALTARPGCAHGGDCELKKVFHPVGIAFKGSGFYKNDARGKGASSGSNPSSSSDTSTSTSTSSDSSTGSSASSSSNGSGSTD